MKRVLTIIFAVCLPLPSFAWGELGHKVSAEIARRHLTPVARAKIDALLTDTDMIDGSVWADHVKKTPPFHHTSRYHFASVPDGMTYLENLASLSARSLAHGDILMALIKSESVLRDLSAPSEQRANALKFILHFTGDLHQPLHTGRPEDRGGTDLLMDWFGKLTNLHAVWDREMIDTAHAADFEGKDERTVIKWYASYLEHHYSKKTLACDWDLLKWFNDALALRSLAYGETPPFLEWPDDENASYLHDALPTLEKQVELSGLHLACLLNEIFSGGSVPAKERKLLANMNQAARRQVLPLIDLDAHTTQPQETIENW